MDMRGREERVMWSTESSNAISVAIVVLSLACMFLLMKKFFRFLDRDDAKAVEETAKETAEEGEE